MLTIIHDIYNVYYNGNKVEIHVNYIYMDVCVYICLAYIFSGVPCNSMCVHVNIICTCTMQWEQQFLSFVERLYNAMGTAVSVLCREVVHSH